MQFILSSSSKDELESSPPSISYIISQPGIEKVDGARPKSNDGKLNTPKLPSNDKKLLFSVENENPTEWIKAPPTIVHVDLTIIAQHLAQPSYDLLSPVSQSNETHFEFVFENEHLNIGSDIPS
ncbi:unnamed protein product [Lepeophtheirus salmonis]|uniref:(salmon louse) hypothetical protein n=1 Tax=Lepeophtheirus salmonis TaxID=72036 RepID=A0A7R8H3H1_LEPSM|nr:unnamed protein product [Lepeophtheirus salmonis]CAF2829795.1 unnamed protein product [Lepeophtheirus salmonis]